MIWNDPSIMVKRKKTMKYNRLVVDVVVLFGIILFFFPACLSTTPSSYLRVQALSQQRFNIYDVIVWFLDEIL